VKKKKKKKKKKKFQVVVHKAKRFWAAINITGSFITRTNLSLSLLSSPLSTLPPATCCAKKVCERGERGERGERFWFFSLAVEGMTRSVKKKQDKNIELNC
jgi:hypothetical protein